MQPSDLRSNVNNLIRGDLLHKWFEVIAARLRAKITPGLTLSFTDGGIAVDNICALVDEAQWKTIAKEFFRSDS